MFWCIFPRAVRNWWEKPCVSHVVKYTIRWESDRTKCPCVGETMGTNFPGCLYYVDFTAFFYAMGNWWGNPCISHIIKFTIGCKSNGKRAPIQWENSQYQFPRFSTYDGFCRTFPGTNFLGFSHSMGVPVLSNAMRNWWEKSCISHIRKYTTGWKSNEKNSPILWKKYGNQFPRPSPFNRFRWLF